MATYITTLKDATDTDALLPRTVLGAIADGNGDYLDDQMLASDLNALKNGKIADMSSKITSLSSTYTMDKWQDGSIDTTNGADYADANAIRYPYKVGIGTGVERLTCDSGYYFLLFAWDLNDNYIGAWKTDGTWSKVASGWKSLQDWDCHDYPDYVFKPVMLKTGIATTDYTHFQFAGLNGSQLGSMISPIVKTTTETKTIVAGQQNDFEWECNVPLGNYLILANNRGGSSIDVQMSLEVEAGTGMTDYLWTQVKGSLLNGGGVSTWAIVKVVNTTNKVKYRAYGYGTTDYPATIKLAIIRLGSVN